GIEGWLKHEDVIDQIVEGDAVQLEICGVLAVAGRVQPLAPLSSRGRCQKPALRRCDRTRNQQSELQELTAIERKVLQRSLIDNLSERDRPLECRNVRNDFNRLRN